MTRNLLTHGSANLIISGLQMATLATFARTLDHHIISGYVLSVATIALCEVLSDFGTRHWAIRELSKRETSATIRYSWLLKGLFSLATVGIGYLYLLFSDRSSLELILAVLVGMTQVNADPYIWRLRSRQNILLEAKLSITNRILVSIGCITVGLYFEALVPILIVWLVCNLLRLTFECFLFRRQLTPNQPLREEQHHIDSTSLTHNNEVSVQASNLVHTIFWMGIASLFIVGYYRLGILYLDQVADHQTIATFGLFFSLASAATIVSNTMANVYYPRLSRSATSKDPKFINNQIDTLLNLFGISFFIGGLLGIFIADPISEMYAGPSYSDSHYLRNLIPWIYLSGLASCLRIALLAAREEHHEFFIIFLSTVYFLGLLWAMDGSIAIVDSVIIAYTLSELALCINRGSKLKRLGYPLLKLWTVLLGALVLTLIIVFQIAS